MDRVTISYHCPEEGTFHFAFVVEGNLGGAAQTQLWQVHPDYPELQRMSGTTVQCISSFQDDLNLAGPVMDNIKRAQYEKPTPVQKHALPIGNFLTFESSIRRKL